MQTIDRSPLAGTADDAVSAFIHARPRMFAAALRTLGNAAEAEDVVQDAWLRWQNTDRGAVRNAPAFLTTTTVRLALNRATGARTRHETSPRGLTEPTDLGAGPGARAERGQALEAALLLLLEKLTPAERAAYLLREAFGYSHRDIARVVHVSEEHARQLAMRARKHLSTRPRVPVSASARQRLTLAFMAATRLGNLSALERMLGGEVAAGRSAGS